VLFVCWANINRSQIAEAIFNGRAARHHAVSAGISPRKAGVPIRTERNNPVQPMGEKGYDLSGARIKRLNRAMADSASKVVIVLGRNHLKDVPRYLLRRPDLEFWEVGGISDGLPFEDYCRLERERIALIEGRVSDLVARLERKRG
jgi:protein-tyrosine-phosphatase